MIEMVTTENFDDVLPLIRAYQEFYQVADIDEAKNRQHFSRFLHDHTRGVLFLQRVDAQAVGFATVYFGYSSVRAEEVGILNDLYVKPQFRGQGLARTLMEHAAQAIKARGLSRMQWLTAMDNATAQRLYDDMGAARSEWLFYAMSL